MKLIAITALAVAALQAAQADDQLTVSMLLAGNIEDNGFMEAGYNGLLKVQEELGAKISYIDKIEPKPEQLAAALRRLAQDGPDMVIAHGGQNNQAAERVAVDAMR